VRGAVVDGGAVIGGSVGGDGQAERSAVNTVKGEGITGRRR